MHPPSKLLLVISKGSTNYFRRALLFGQLLSTIHRCPSGTCPQDVPDGVTAAPQCALQDTSGNKYCALLCTPGSNDSCGKATCKAIQGVGICTYDD